MLEQRRTFRANSVDIAGRTWRWTLRWIRRETEDLVARRHTTETTESIRTDPDR